MKKNIFILFVIIFIVFLTGCNVDIPENKNIKEVVKVQEKTTIVEKETLTEMTIPKIDGKIEGLYQTGSLLLSDDTGKYIFSGFLDEDTLVILVKTSVSSYHQGYGYAEEYYFTVKRGSRISLPYKNIHLNIVNMDVENNIVEFEQL